MLCHLPRPYDDELLYSVIARYLARYAIPAAPVVRNLFGALRASSPAFPGALAFVAARTAPVWGMSAETIADSMTLLPYYMRYIPTDRAEQCLRALCSANTKGLHLKLGITAATVRPPGYLRFCAECRIQDLRNLGETYWRRAHQLPGCHVCSEHGCLLCCSEVPYEPSRALEYADATEHTVGIDAPQMTFRDEDIPKLTDVARRCRAILLGGVTLWQRETLPGAYVGALEERGFTNRGSGVMRAKVVEALAEYYGAHVLDGLGMSCTEGQHWWVQAMFHKQTAHPARHAVFQLFLENTPVVHTVGLGLREGPWRCPNSFAEHRVEYPIRSVQLKPGPNGSRFAVGKCPCGFSFAFRATRNDDPRMPIVSKRLAYGASWEAEARRQRAEGLRLRDIMANMKVDLATLHRLLGLPVAARPSRTRARQAAGPPSPDDREAWREEWLIHVAKFPIRGREAAKLANRSLYWRLRRLDRDWLESVTPTQPQNARRHQVDWEERDREWAARLRAAAVTIRAQVPLKRASAKAIIDSALTSTVRNHLDHLPECSRTLRESAESVDEFRARRLRAAAQKLRAMGLPCTHHLLRLHSSLQSEELGPELLALIRSLVDGT